MGAKTWKTIKALKAAKKEMKLGTRDLFHGPRCRCLPPTRCSEWIDCIRIMDEWNGPEPWQTFYTMLVINDWILWLGGDVPDPLPFPGGEG